MFLLNITTPKVTLMLMLPEDLVWIVGRSSANRTPRKLRHIASSASILKLQPVVCGGNVETLAGCLAGWQDVEANVT